MSVAVFLLIILLLALATGVVIVVGSYLSPGARDNRAELREARQNEAAAKARERLATKALRSIANGAGNPIFEAQDALDQIESTYTKELN